MPTKTTKSSARTRKTRSSGESKRKLSSPRSSRASASKKAIPSKTPESDSSQLDKLFTDTLKDIYWAEKHLTKALPKMQKAATTEELREAIEEHLAQTEEHVTRLEQVFELCGKKTQAKKCDGMEGLIKEGESIIKDTEDESMTRDAGLIMAAQKVEHYEITTYGCLVQFAKTLGFDDAAGILEQTLEEEKATDKILTKLAEGGINQQAEQEDEEDGEKKEGDYDKVEAEEEK